jgi:hypothetical protein
LPLSAVLVWQLNWPSLATLALGKMTLAVPLPEIFWHVRHQQMRAITGSP